MDQPNATNVTLEGAEKNVVENNPDKAHTLTATITTNLPGSPSGFSLPIGLAPFLNGSNQTVVEITLSKGVWMEASGNPNSTEGYTLTTNHINSGKEDLIWHSNKGNPEEGTNEKTQCEEAYQKEYAQYEVRENARNIALNIAYALDNTTPRPDAFDWETALKTGANDPEATTFTINNQGTDYTIQKPSGYIIDLVEVWETPADTHPVVHIMVVHPETGQNPSVATSDPAKPAPTNKCE